MYGFCNIWPSQIGTVLNYLTGELSLGYCFIVGLLTSINLDIVDLYFLVYTVIP